MGIADAVTHRSYGCAIERPFLFTVRNHIDCLRIRRPVRNPFGGVHRNRTRASTSDGEQPSRSVSSCACDKLPIPRETGPVSLTPSGVTLFQLSLQPIQLLVQLHFESLQTLPIDSSTSPVRFHLLPGHLQVLPLVHFVN